MELKIEYLSPHDLRPYEHNTRKHAPDDIGQIKASIAADGFNDPIGIWGDDNLIVEGHGRQIAAIEMGLERVPCIRLDHLTDAQRRDYAIRHNFTSDQSEFDFGRLREEVAALELQGLDMSYLDGIGEELDALGQESIDDYDIKEDEPPEPPEEPTAKRGQIWRLGEHRLMCGDATNIDDADRLMDGARADISITSPPYGEGKSAKLRDHYVKGAKKRQSLYNAHDDDRDEWADLIDGSLSVMRASSDAQFINIQMLADNKRDLMRILANHAEQLCDIMIWDKEKAPPQMHDNVLNNEFEFLFVFADDGATRTFPYSDFHGNVSNIIRIKTGVNEFADVHRAVFPVEFPAQIMKIASKAKTVLDVFGGTGTTLIACEQMGRTCYMMELDPRYCDVIIQRWENLTGEKAVLLN